MDWQATFTNARKASRTVLRAEYQSDGSIRWVVKREQDVDAVVQSAKVIHDASGGKLVNGERVLGRIPSIVWDEMLADGRAHDDAAIRRWLDENPYCKAWQPDARVKAGKR